MPEQKLAAAKSGASTKRAPRTYRRDRYGVVCCLILATILSTSVLGEGVAGLVVTLVLMAATLTFTLRTSNAGRRALQIGTAVSVVAVVAIGFAVVADNAEPARLAYEFAMLGLVGVTPVVIGRRLATHKVVSLKTVTGAAAIYLLIGLLFAVIYSTIGGIMVFALGASSAGSAFFIATRPLGPSDFVYYSFTTLTTVGYGDLTGAVAIGRMLSICEALIGQLYLVTVVAVLVANMGRSRRRNADDSGITQPAEDD
jgi:hypothetical protein